MCKKRKFDLLFENIIKEYREEDDLMSDCYSADAYNKKAAKNGTESQKIVLARNPNTSSEILETLANDINSAVRRYVAENPSTPNYILRQLVNDQDEFVRRSAMNNFHN